MVRAFKSTLEEVEDRRSSHSGPTLRAGGAIKGYNAGRPYSELLYVDDTRNPAYTRDLPYPGYLARQQTVPEVDVPEVHVAGGGQKKQGTPEAVPLLTASGKASSPTTTRRA